MIEQMTNGDSSHGPGPATQDDLRGNQVRILANQAQINPVEVLNTLVSDIRGRGGSIVGGVRLQDVTGSGPATVHTDHGTVTANEVSWPVPTSEGPL